MRGEGVSDLTIVAVKRRAWDLYGDIRRGENTEQETGSQRRRVKHVSDGIALRVTVTLRLENNT